MTINTRESFVVHFYHGQDGNIVARVTDPATRATWTIVPAFQLRMMIANGFPSISPISELYEEM